MALAKEERERAARGEGCLGKTRDDEPVFVLRAQDKFAPALVSLWARWCKDAVLQETRAHPDAGSHPTYKKAREAETLSEQMRDWQKETGRAKTPD